MSKKILLIFSVLFSLGIVIYSCVDDDLMHEHEEGKKLKISTVSMTEVPFLQEKIAHVKQQKNGTSYLDSINTEQVLRMIDTLGVDNFTFSLTNTEAANVLTNLVATKNTNNTWRLYMVRYTVNENSSVKEFLQGLSSHTNTYTGSIETLDLQGNVISKKNYENGQVTSSNKSCEEIVDEFIECTCEAHHRGAELTTCTCDSFQYVVVTMPAYGPGCGNSPNGGDGDDGESDDGGDSNGSTTGPFIPIKPCPGDPVIRPTIAGTRTDHPSKYGGTFGCTRFTRDDCDGLYSGNGSQKHEGLDIANPDGFMFYAMYSGTVIAKYTSAPNNRETNPGIGNYVEVETIGIFNGQMETIRIKYAHLKDVKNLANEDIDVGDYVFQGLKLGTSGKSGNAYDVPNKHIHIEVKKQNANGNWEKVDPEPYLHTKFDDNYEPIIILCD